MKFLRFCLVVSLLMCGTASFAQYVKYEVKVILDSVRNVKGTLQKVTADGLAIEDYRGNYHIFKAKNIVKIKVRRKGITVLDGLGVGAGLGFAGGAGIFFSEDNFDDFGEKLAGTIFFTGVGAMGGTLVGLVAEGINSKLILNINTNEQKFKKEYLKLQKYSKSYFFDQPNPVVK